MTPAAVTPSAVASPKRPLPLTPHPSDVPWPTMTWATGPQLSGDSDRLDEVLDRGFRKNPNPELALSLAFIAVQGGRIVAERYGPQTTASSALTSWSMAKSITQAAVGIATLDNTLDIDATPVAAEWESADDPRHGISLRHLLSMRSGLEFNEDYVDTGTSHCLEMLFGSGGADMAHYAASQKLVAPIDSLLNYASGSTNIVSRALASAYGFDRAGMENFLRERLFDPLGMSSAQPHFDEAGTFVGSSYVDATARDFARFGYLYLRDGVWKGTRILPEGWVDLARTATGIDAETGLGYGSGWWTRNDGSGFFAAQGYEGQLIAVVPELDLVFVRLGKTPIEHRPGLVQFTTDVISSFVDA